MAPFPRYGSPNKANSYLVHGAALGTDEVAATRENLKWNYEPFEIPQEVYDHMSAVSKGAELESAWDKTMGEYAEKYPEDAAEFKQLISGELPEGWADVLPTAKSDTAGNATRIHSQTMLNTLAPVLPGTQVSPSRQAQDRASRLLSQALELLFCFCPCLVPSRAAHLHRSDRWIR